MASLKDRNHHSRDDHITFEEESHTYTIDGDDSYISVTSWIGSCFPEFNQELVLDRMMNSPN